MIEKRNDSPGRIIWVDIAKGLAILLVVIGHTVQNGIHGSIIRGAIFSFHMPLFFILSGFTLRCSESLEVFFNRIKVLIRKLIIPAIFVWAVLLFYNLLQDHSLIGQINFWKNQIYSLLVGSGVEERVFGNVVPALGKPWFLYALFFARIIFDFIHFSVKGSQRVLWYMSLALLGIMMGQILRPLFSLDLALTVLPFMYFGYILSHKTPIQNSFHNMLVVILIWLVTLFLQFPSCKMNTYLELVQRRYPLFPLCFITAIAGSMVLMELSVYFARRERLFLPLAFIGRHSMVFFVVHCLDKIWMNFWMVDGHQLISSVFRIAVDFLIFLIFILSKRGLELLSGRHGARI